MPPPCPAGPPVAALSVTLPLISDSVPKLMMPPPLSAVFAATVQASNVIVHAGSFQSPPPRSAEKLFVMWHRLRIDVPDDTTPPPPLPSAALLVTRTSSSVNVPTVLGWVPLLTIPPAMPPTPP